MKGLRENKKEGGSLDFISWQDQRTESELKRFICWWPMRLRLFKM